MKTAFFHRNENKQLWLIDTSPCCTSLCALPLFRCFRPFRRSKTAELQVAAVDLPSSSSHSRTAQLDAGKGFRGKFGSPKQRKEGRNGRRGGERSQGRDSRESGDERHTRKKVFQNENRNTSFGLGFIKSWTKICGNYLLKHFDTNAVLFSRESIQISECSSLADMFLPIKNKIPNTFYWIFVFCVCFVLGFCHLLHHIPSAVLQPTFTLSWQLVRLPLSSPCQVDKFVWRTERLRRSRSPQSRSYWRLKSVNFQMSSLDQVSKSTIKRSSMSTFP